MTEEVARITWTGDGKAGVIEPGQFQDFGLSLALPDKPGRKLTFKALQTYDNGEVVRWIGPPDSDEPAPQVELTASVGGHGAGAQTAAKQSAAVSTNDDDGAPIWLAVVALVVGALGLLAGIGGLKAGRRHA